MKTLIVGCSFPYVLREAPINRQFINYKKYSIRATPGAGNQSIAQRVLYECSLNKYSNVIVIWSGINRLDCPIPIELHKTYHSKGWGHTVIQSTVWWHSGGIHGGWVDDLTLPADVRRWFKTQYLGACTDYLNDISFSNIALIQQFFEAKNISYQMSFIYDIHKDYSQTSLGHCLGQADTDNIYYRQVNWNKIKINDTIYEWLQQDNSRLKDDQFHPTQSALKQWFAEKLNIDLTQ
jgi:hypothetical protein